MRSPVSMTAGLALGLVLGLFARTPSTATSNAGQMADAAFRDGSYVASLDAQGGKKPHLMSGRWNSTADRAMFIVGYEQTYQDAAKSSKANAAEIAGYLDGMADGAADGAASRTFRSEKTPNFVNARHDSVPSGASVATFQGDYRSAYANGYQQGYFTNQNASLWSYYAK
jgi:hypothetical protein